jgi:hypothetical protein
MIGSTLRKLRRLRRGPALAGLSPMCDNQATVAAGHGLIALSNLNKM